MKAPAVAGAKHATVSAPRPNPTHAAMKAPAVAGAKRSPHGSGRNGAATQPQ